MKIKIAISILFPLFYIAMVGCIQKTTVTTTSSPHEEKMGSKPKTVYYIDDNADGVFEEIVPEEEPIPFEGKDEFRDKLFSSYRYPPSARENGISGFVVLEILVDEFGFVKEVNIKRSLTKECDDVVKNAFMNATTNGYATFKWKGANVKYKMDYPFGFYLQ